MTCAGILVIPAASMSAVPRVVGTQAGALAVPAASMSAGVSLIRNLRGNLGSPSSDLAATLCHTPTLAAVLSVGRSFAGSASPDISDDSLIDPAIALLPPGRLFRPVGELLRRLLDGLLREFSRIAHRARQLLAQACPCSTGDLSHDWARVCGVATAAEVPSRWAEGGPLTRARVLGMFPDFWSEAPVSKMWVPRAPFRAGIAAAGQPLRPATSRLAIDLTLTCAAFASASSRESFLASVAPALSFLDRRWFPYSVLVIRLSDGETTHAIRKIGGRL